MLLSTCKKYYEGGFLALSRKHLFGEKKDGASKTWKLKLYEVNAIDSTQLIPGAGNIPDFYNKFITFKLDNKIGYTFTAHSAIYDYAGYVNYASSKEIGMNSSESSNPNSSQCGVINNTSLCVRNIFEPEGLYKSNQWRIVKLTKKEFIITISLQNNYKIALSQ